MPSARFLARRLADRAFGTEFDRALARAVRNRSDGFLFFWNRGLGDIALGLVPLFERIRRALPRARIAVVTREELRVPFALTGVDEVHVLPGLAREARISLPEACRQLGMDPATYTTAFDYPDPNRWLEGRRREIAPRLRWNRDWNPLADAVVAAGAGIVTVGAHVHSETARYYGYRKDWPAPAWQQLIARFPASAGVHWLLLGNAPQPVFEGANVQDLRGRTDFATLMSVIRNRARVLLAPDSGVLTMAYYLDEDFPIDVISLWADPRQGVLLQDCASPNPRLVHAPLLSSGEDLANLPVDTVAAALERSLATARAC